MNEDVAVVLTDDHVAVVSVPVVSVPLVCDRVDSVDVSEAVMERVEDAVVVCGVVVDDCVEDDVAVVV